MMQSKPPPVPGAHGTGSEHYRIITDTVAGPNVRLKDNLYQALAIFVCAALGAVAGALFAKEKVAGAALGGIAGLVVGLLGSGIFLMIYRAVRHAQGKHD